jgi:hypothetical protein
MLDQLDTRGKKYFMDLLSMDEKDFSTSSLGFLLDRMIGVSQGKYTVEQFNDAKVLVDALVQARILKSDLEKPLPKWPERGWLLPYLFDGDRAFGTKRWDWWANCLLQMEVTGSIPQVEFGTYRSAPGVTDTLSHIDGCLRKLESRGFSRPLMFWVEWLLWGFGSSTLKERPRIPEEVEEILYKDFQLGLMQMHPFDYMAVLAQEVRSGNSRWSNPTAFYQTPPNVCQCMVQMMFHDTPDSLLKSVIDPCAGTGTLLLFASNYSVNLHAAELSYDLVLMCEVNAWLYMPWLVRPAYWLRNGNTVVAENELENNEKKVVVGSKELMFKQDADGQMSLFD